MSKYRQAPSVKPGIIIGIIAFFVVLIGAIVLFTNSPERQLFIDYSNVNTSLKNDTDFKNHVFDVTSVKDVRKKFENNETFVLLVGSTTCQACTEGIKHYNSEFIRNVETLKPAVGAKIFYLDAAATGIYQLLVDEGIVQASEDGSFGTPQLVFIQEGALKVTRSNITANTERLIVLEFYKKVIAAL